ncbi:MAG: pantoate--beta-alanine ligase [Chitinophagales bacterium]
MILFKKAKDLQHHLNICRQKGQRSSVQKTGIGFVPTMGALHDGHISLIKNSIRENQISVCSIFVNPAQFNDLNDFKKYPSTLEQDILKLETNGCDILFLPHVEEIYPEGIEKRQHYDLGYLETILEGEFRPGHFQGVCMAVERLLAIVQPDVLYLGQKDYQQCMIITKLIEIMGLKEKIKIRICPILREKDGLAMSSRNMRLSEEQRVRAPEIYKTLLYLKQTFGKESLEDLRKEAADLLQKKGFRTDYVEIADSKTLKPINEWDPRTNILGLVAVYIDNVRLIDNIMLNQSD